MNKILEENLLEIPDVEKGKTPRDWFFWGIECDNGWYDLLHDLFLELSKLNCNIMIHQIKEKYGNLRFYYSYESDEKEFRFPHKFNRFTKFKLQEFIDFIRVKILRYKTIDEKIFELIDYAENQSCKICEVCGSPGRIRNYGWLKCLCIKHYLEVLEKHDNI